MVVTKRGNRLVLSRRRLIAAGLATGALVPLSSARAQTAPAASPVATPAGTPVVGADSPVGIQFAWVLDQLNAGAADLTEATVAERFSPEFLAEVSAAELITVLRQIGAQGPFAAGDYAEAPGGLEARAVLTPATGEALAMSILVEDTPPHQITGLLFQPAAAATPVPLASWDDFDRQWSALAPAVNFLAADVVDGARVPVHALNPDERLAIGSAFKLYILGELANQVRDGEAAWDERLAIRDDWKATFSGPMSSLGTGEERTLREFAAQMISVSDNTATDHLLFHLGRENVEAIQAEMGHGAPEVNQPTLSTEEMFQLKLAAPAELVEAYLAADVEERRRLLETEVAGLPLSPMLVGWWQSPTRIDQIEWFASAVELCQAMATLEAWSRQPGLEPITEILAINPGLPFDSTVWEYIGFKGGSEIGVLNMTWLLRQTSGRTFVLTGSLNDTAAPIDEPAAFGLLQAAALLLETSVG